MIEDVGVDTAFMRRNSEEFQSVLEGIYICCGSNGYKLKITYVDDLWYFWVGGVENKKGYIFLGKQKDFLEGLKKLNVQLDEI